MFKKTLISLAVASSLGLTGCFDSGSDTKNANPDPKYTDPAIDGKTWPLFNPATGALPLPNDLIFRSDDEETAASEADGTFEVDNTRPPVTAALNQLSGASTVAPIVIQTNGQLLESSVQAGQTVHLIELAYASGDPVQGLGNQEPPTLAILEGAPQPKIRADVESLDGRSAIRIVPLEPLNPRSRYIVLVTTGVLDINGDPIISDPVYSNVTDADAGLISSALAPVRALVNGLWERFAVGYSQALFSLGALEAPITESDIALTYSFTTSNDNKVLRYIAEPATWFSDQIKNFVAVSAATRTQESSQGTADFGEISDKVEDAITTFPLSLGLDPENTPQELADVLGGACSSVQGQSAIDCLAIALASKYRDDLPTPTVEDRAGTITLDAAPRGAAQVSLLAASVLSDPTSVLAVEGTISLPNYLGNEPAELVGATADGNMIGNWVADDQLAAQISGLLQGVGAPALPHANPTQTGTTAVNYIFPFPKQNSDQPTIEAPILVLYPSDPANVKGIVSFQHGITTDRSTALTFGTALAEQGYVVAAIDHPLHGVSPFSTAQQGELAGNLVAAAILNVFGAASVEDLPAPQQQLLGNAVTALAPEALTALAQAEGSQVSYFIDQVIAFEEANGIPDQISDSTGFSSTVGSLLNTVENAGSQIPGLAPRLDGESLLERHFGLFPGSDGTPAQMVFDPANPSGVGENGRFFINLQNFLKTRDNLRQSVLDQMNLRASLGSLELPFLDGQGGVTRVDLSGRNVYFAGHSLGGITGTSFVDAINADALDFPELGKVTFLNSGSPTESVFSAENNIQAASLLTPGSGIVRLLENSESFAPVVLGGLFDRATLAQGDSALETFLNVAQATIDSADPINFVGQLTTDTLISMVIADDVIPNAADANVWADSIVADAYNPAPLSGMLEGIPYEVNSFSAPLSGTVPMFELGSDAVMQISYDPAVLEGVEHGTPVDPTSSAAGFGLMVCTTLELFDQPNQYCVN
jgi:hypothetical protein